jgi:hypothetical protein
VTRNSVLIVLVGLVLAGCSNRAVYDNIMLDQRNRCFNEPPPVYSECIERTSKSYEEYKREQQELLDEPSKK